MTFAYFGQGVSKGKKSKSPKGRHIDYKLEKWSFFFKCVEVDKHGVNVLIYIKRFKNFCLLSSLVAFFAFSISNTIAFFTLNRMAPCQRGKPVRKIK